MKIAISAESTIDLTKEIKNKFNIYTVPFTISLGEKIIEDGEILPEEIINYYKQNKKLPKTSAVNEYQYEQHFTNLLKDYDAVIHFSLSSELSSAYQNAEKVAQKLKNVYIIDSRSLSTGIALLAIYASKLVNKTTDINEVLRLIKERIPFVQASFILEKLDFLYKGGRCNSLQYLGANLLKIKPQIIVENGKMVTGKKYLGKFNETVIKYCQDILSKFNNPDKSEIFITYTTCPEDLLSEIKTLLKNNNFKNINITTAGGTITSHCGENCIGILYINDGKSQL